MNLKSEISSFEIDAFSPAQIAKRVEAAASTKANTAFLQLLMLAILAGAFIAFGAIAYTLVTVNEGACVAVVAHGVWHKAPRCWGDEVLPEQPLRQ